MPGHDRPKWGFSGPSGIARSEMPEGLRAISASWGLAGNDFSFSQSLSMTMNKPCRTCRSRKKACDGARPACRRCCDSGRRCAGYDSSAGVFVNLDANSIKKPVKGLIKDAIDVAKGPHTHHPANSVLDGTVPIFSVYTLDLSTGEFQDHFSTLWAHFHDRYARTSDVWSAGVSSLRLHNKALDLAMVALATMRLSLCGQGEIYQVFSLSAYNTSLQIFRRLLQCDSRAPRAPLVVISLIFTLFEAVQQRPTQIYCSGWAGHLKGALTLIQHQGPSSFQVGGFHAAFKKIREMSRQVLFSFSRQEKSFFIQPQWMTIPWKKIKKTSRDYLFDIAVRMTEVCPALHLNPGDKSLSNFPDIPQTLWRCQRLYWELMQWRKHWLEEEYNDFPIPCRGCGEELCQCLPHTSLSPCNEFAYKSAEWLALLLLLSITTSHLVGCGATDYPSPTISASHSPRMYTLERRCRWLRSDLQNMLSLPCFGKAASDLPGITEGRCRSLLPNWVLSQGLMLSDDHEQKWWSTLDSRLNHGILQQRVLISFMVVLV
ncbi:hypothetical protein NUU61_009325 [Penicillium alfredii]|uniref:Zn(2)-C6 fungal-type domain-containing protein n=1 Tax=Penicillium alfredii TaxID=1506179 RepID=A0A9W9EN58_9EURO|nr:uncharacterized protein NUU61_009325 [Penicillium alfredii]KAJ5084746.1 hypothetical protein NUU61_009325 [Penicillium alfredii]